MQAILISLWSSVCFSGRLESLLTEHHTHIHPGYRSIRS